MSPSTSAQSWVARNETNAQIETATVIALLLQELRPSTLVTPSEKEVKIVGLHSLVSAKSDDFVVDAIRSQSKILAVGHYRS
jgi:RNA 3'-terminal phosphate cyclase